MKTFAIENDTDRITIHLSAAEARKATSSECFDDEAELVRRAADWPTSRLIRIWNSLPGTVPVKKFTSRKTAVSRIWKALQSIPQMAPPEAAGAATQEETGSGELVPVEASGSLPIRVVTSPGSGSEPAPTPASQQTEAMTESAAPRKTGSARISKDAGGTSGVPRQGSKTNQVIVMLSRQGGATLEEVVTATGWQRHTARALLSAGGALTKNHGIHIVSEKHGGTRTYSVRP